MAGKFKKADTSFNFGNNLKSGKFKTTAKAKKAKGPRGRKPKGGGS